MNLANMTMYCGYLFIRLDSFSNNIVGLRVWWIIWAYILLSVDYIGTQEYGRINCVGVCGEDELCAGGNVVRMNCVLVSVVRVNCVLVRVVRMNCVIRMYH